MAYTLHFPSADQTRSSLCLPPSLVNPGLLVGWSLEHQHPTRPIGFTYGDPARIPSTGFIEPIQLAQDGHLITIAPTGAGKGRGCIIPALLRHEGPIIVIDPKGENVAITARGRREMGQQVIVLDPMRITDEPPGAFNPLDMIDINSPIAVDEIAAISSALWAGPVDSRDRFWVSRAQQVTIGLLLHLLADKSSEFQNLAGLRRLVSESINDTSAMIEQLSGSRHPEARNIAAMLQIPAVETMGGIMSFAQELIDFLRGPLIEESTSSSSFDVSGITRGDQFSIYLVLPPHMLESHGRLLRLWISAFITGITRRRAKPEKSTLFILDEAAQLGPLSQLRQAITLLRGYGVQTWSFWQDVSQIKMLYPDDWQTMINNCRVLQCFGALNMNAAADMAQLTGFGLAEHVLALEPDEMILQLAGDEAVIARLPDYLTDPAFANQFDPNPYYINQGEIMPRKMPPIRLYERSEKPTIYKSHQAETYSSPSEKKPLTPEIERGGHDTFLSSVPNFNIIDYDEIDPLLKRLLVLWEK